MLNRDEIRSVIAHELGHIRNRDTLIMTAAATLAGALSHLANMAMWGAFRGAPLIRKMRTTGTRRQVFWRW